MSQLAGLTNEQIVFIYLRLKKYADYVNELMLEGYATRKITIGFGDVKAETKITDDDLQFIMEIPVVKMYMDIEKSLAPIVDIIKDSDPELFEKMDSMISEAESGEFFVETESLDDDDDDSEEDEG
jgi:hypothetical protein